MKLGRNCIHAHPDGMRFALIQRKLRIGGDGSGEESDFPCQRNQVVDILLAVVPYHRLAALEIHETRTQIVGVLQIITDLLIAFHNRLFTTVNIAEYSGLENAMGCIAHGVTESGTTEPLSLSHADII